MQRRRVIHTLHIHLTQSAQKTAMQARRDMRIMASIRWRRRGRWLDRTYRLTPHRRRTAQTHNSATTRRRRRRRALHANLTSAAFDSIVRCALRYAQKICVSESSTVFFRKHTTQTLREALAEAHGRRLKRSASNRARQQETAAHARSAAIPLNNPSCCPSDAIHTIACAALHARMRASVSRGTGTRTHTRHNSRARCAFQ